MRAVWTILIVAVILAVVGLVWAVKTGRIDLRSASATTDPHASLGDPDPDSKLALSVDLQRIKTRVGPSQVRHSSYRFAVHVPPTHLGEGWKAILNPVAKRLFLKPADRAGIEWYITSVTGVTFIAHDRGDVFTHCHVTFTDHTGKYRHMITPLTPDPKLAHEVSVYFENYADPRIIAEAMATALGGT